jgi:type I restriction enzyme R subunit
MRGNVFVLVDEAHRTTSGDLGTYLMAALPKATIIGFTGTPIDRTAYGKGTFKTFGLDDESGYLDKYSIRESIEEGATVPLHYSLAPNELKVDRETLDREFLDLVEAEGVSDVEELNRVLDKAVNLRNMLKNPERVDRVAAYLARHFREVVEPMGYKAFLVGVDREACTFLKDALDRYLPPEYSRVVYSPAHNDQPALKRFHMSEEEEKQVRKDFIKPDRLPKILIVTEKLLTGYDAPILYCMYLDKPMRDHVLLQAIARVNRPYEDENGQRKPSGFVFDFVGIFDNLEKALAFDSKDVSGVIEDLDVLKAKFREDMAKARAEYLTVLSGKIGDKAIEAGLEHFREPETRQAFYKFFLDLEDLYEILSPDAFLRDYLRDYETLALLYQVLRADYDAGITIDREFSRKTAKLVQEETRGSPIHEPTATYEITEDTLKALEASDAPDTVKVFNLVKALRREVEINSRQAPYLLSIGQRAEEIVRLFQERQLTTQQALEALQALVAEYQKAEGQRKERNLPTEAFAVYWLLDRQKVSSAETVANEMATVFGENPHWRASGDQARSVRVALTAALIRSGQSVESVGPIVDGILKVVSEAGR